MFAYKRLWTMCLSATAVFTLAGPLAVQQDEALLKQVLSYKPTQANIDYDSPAADELAKCKLQTEQTGGGSGYVVLGPQGQMLRRFTDTNGDGKVDEFRYFKYGMEVYRDLDTNGNDKIDQSRWFNIAGTRWGVDQDEDKRIDSWKMISAEEASREAVQAMAARDEKRFFAVLINLQDIKQLGMTGDAAVKLTANIKEASARFRAASAGSKIITPKTEWVRFDCSMLFPNLIPADSGKAKNELLVYENVMAFVQNSGENGYVQIGEMIRVGDAWKLTQTPQPLEGANVAVSDGGVLLQPSLPGGATSSEGLTPKVKELLDKLKDLDAKAPQANPAPQDLVKYNVARAGLLAQLAEEAPTNDEKITWQRQRLEGIAAATQMESFPNGLDELKKAEQQMRAANGDADLLAFVVFQRMFAEYNLQLAKADLADRGKILEAWLKALDEFVKEFPKSAEAADAILQLATTHEYNGATDQAKAWYQKLVSGYAQSKSAAPARGALRRLDLAGKPLKFTGKSLSGGTIDVANYRGKVLAIIYWATWCQPCREELPQVKELYKTYQKDGFEIVGVNLDTPDAPIQQYIKTYGIPWDHIHEEGGAESRPAIEFGVISPPTVFLLDRKGTVVSANATLEDLKKQVPELLLKK